MIFMNFYKRIDTFKTVNKRIKNGWQNELPTSLHRQSIGRSKFCLTRS